MKQFQIGFLAFLFFGYFCFGQNDKTSDLDKNIIEYFQKYYSNDEREVTKDSLLKGFRENNFNVSISDNPLEFDTIRLVFKNPYFSEKFEESDDDKDYVKNFPKAYSVLYKNHLISLFENGKFFCFNLKNNQRNFEFEEQLNSKKMDYQWIIENKLIALKRNTFFEWNGKKWIKSKINFPFKNQKILFDDNEFLVFSDCNGEWGGTIYFFEKLTSNIYYTESTCVNSVVKNKDGYLILAHLGHGAGSINLKIVENPKKLSVTNYQKIRELGSIETLGYLDKSNAFRNLTSFYGIQTFSFFDYSKEKLYIVNGGDLTFLAKINSNEVELVHPLFFDDLYTHYPKTSQFGEYTLINLDHYGTGLDREISVLIIHENQITKIDWNEKHN